MEFPKLPKVEELNLKIEKVAKELGKSSKLYKDYKHYIEHDFPGQFNYGSDGSTIQLKSDFELTGEVEELKKYAHLSRMPSIDEVVERGKKLLNIDKLIAEGSKIERQKAIDRYKDTEYIQKIIEDKHTILYEYEHAQYEKALDTLHIKGRKKTYDELRKVAKILNSKKIRKEAIPKKFKP